MSSIQKFPGHKSFLIYFGFKRAILSGISLFFLWLLQNSLYLFYSLEWYNGNERELHDKKTDTVSVLSTQWWKWERFINYFRQKHGRNMVQNINRHSKVNWILSISVKSAGRLRFSQNMSRILLILGSIRLWQKRSFVGFILGADC